MGEKYETDILVQAQFKDEESYFLIHVENQASSQANFNKRMFRYFARLNEKYDKPVYPIAVFSFDEPMRPEPNSYEVAFLNKKVLQFEYEVIQLNRLDWHDFLNRPNPVASALMAKMKIAADEAPTVKAECMAMLFGLKLDEARTQLVKGFISTYLDLDETQEQVFRTKLGELVPEVEKERVMEVLDSWTKQGLVQGRREGKAETLIKLISLRFGKPVLEIEARVSKLSENELDSLTEALLGFSDLTELNNWLVQQK